MNKERIVRSAVQHPLARKIMLELEGKPVPMYFGESGIEVYHVILEEPTQ